MQSGFSKVSVREFQLCGTGSLWLSKQNCGAGYSLLPCCSPHTPPLLPAISTTLQTLCTMQLLRLHHGKCDYLSGERLVGSSGIDSGIMVLLSFTYFSAFSDWLFLIIAPMDLFQNQHNVCSSAETNGKEQPLFLL